MSTLLAADAREARRGGYRSQEARRLFRDMMAVQPEIRRGFIAGLSDRDRIYLFAAAERESGTAYGLWRDDPVGFIEDVLGESMWSRSRQILAAIPGHRSIAVPSCFASSKSWGIARAALWFANVHPIGTARVVTIAPQWRQVSGIMWPEIRMAHTRAKLPGDVGDVQLKIKSSDGAYYRVVNGIVGNPRNEATTQGIHAPHLLLLVDEAGGIPHGVGRNLRALLTGSDTRMVAIGNPPSDDEGSWFEEFCARDETLVIPISAYDTPAFTGERAPRCRSCPPEVDAHPLSKHLVDRQWVKDTITEFGADSPYVAAKVEAKFPRGGGDRALPSSWVEAAINAPEPDPADDPQWVRLRDLDLPDETSDWHVRLGAWVRLGVDVAAAGGDEFCISRVVGDLGVVRHTSSGETNANEVDVAGKVLVEIKAAERLRAALGTTAKVRVKVDAIGVGWGVASTLERWGEEGVHGAEIVSVNVAEATGREADPQSAMKPWRKRDEMWLCIRDLLRPAAPGESGALRLRIDRRTHAQLVAPRYGTTTSGFTRIESKDSLRVRGLRSPDRAESMLLAWYEPLVAPPGGRPATLIV